MSHYAYVHARPETVDAHGIFYVGKGVLTRALSFSPSERNNLHGKIVNKHGRKNILVGTIECSSESIAFDLEKGLIKCLRRMGVALANFTNGGDGSSGWTPSEETKRKMSLTHKALAKTNGLAERMRKWALEKGALVHLGRKRTCETRDKISKALTGRTLSDDHKVAVSSGHLTKGFKWMKKGNICLKVSSVDISSKQAEGFIFGRIMKSMDRQNGQSK